MPKLLLCALCDDVRVEQSGKHILIGLFDRFNVVDFTQPLPPFKLFAKVGTDEAGTHAFSMTLQSEQGDMKVQLPGEMEAAVRSEVTDLFEGVLVLNIAGLRLPRPGRYHVMLSLGNKEIGGCTFMAKTSTPPTIQ